MFCVMSFWTRSTCVITALGYSFLIHVVLNWKPFSDKLMLAFGMIKYIEGVNKTFKKVLVCHFCFEGTMR